VQMASSTFPQFSVFKFGSRPGAHHLAHHPGLVGLVSSTFWPFCIAYTVTSGNESTRYRTTAAIRAPDAVDFEEPDTAAQSTLHPVGEYRIGRDCAHLFPREDVRVETSRGFFAITCCAGRWSTREDDISDCNLHLGTLFDIHFVLFDCRHQTCLG